MLQDTAMRSLREKYNVGTTSYMFLVDIARRDRKLELQKINKRTEIIKTVVCNWYGVDFDDMIPRNRKTVVVFPRQVCMALFKRNTSLPLREIGRMFGNRHYTTVIHAVKTIQDFMDVDDNFRNDFLALESKIN